MIWHIIPEDDIEQHEESSTCECNPKIIKVEGGDLIVVHSSYDGREGLEYINEILNKIEQS